MKSRQEFLVPWSARGHCYTSDEIKAVVSAMRDADPLTQGRYQAEFENACNDFFGVRHSFAVSSATAALELSALLTRIGPGDEVIIPAHTFAATAIPFARTGARIVWADINPATRLVTAETVGKLITRKTKVIVVVHLYGLSADMDPLMRLARPRGCFVVEDAAQAPGVHYRNERAGTIGDFGVFSFHTAKNITTLGEGGLLVVKDSRLAKLVPGLRHNGIRSFEGARIKYWIPAMSNVDFDIDGLWPYNFCIGEVQCALGTQLLKRLDSMNAQRQKRAQEIIFALQNFPELEFQKVPEGCEHVYHLLACRYQGSNLRSTRDRFIEIMAFKKKIKVIVQYCPLYRYPMFIKAGFGRADCPETDAFYDSMVSFPFHHWLRTTQVDSMVKAIKETLHSLRT